MHYYKWLELNFCIHLVITIIFLLKKFLSRNDDKIFWAVGFLLSWSRYSKLTIFMNDPRVIQMSNISEACMPINWMWIPLAIYSFPYFYHLRKIDLPFPASVVCLQCQLWSHTSPATWLPSVIPGDLASQITYWPNWNIPVNNTINEENMDKMWNLLFH